MLTLDDISQAIESTLASFDIKAAYVFGSYARNEAIDESDVDIRLVCGSSIGYGDLYHIKQRLEALLSVPVEIITNAPERMRPAFRERIAKDEVCVYEAA